MAQRVNHRQLEAFQAVMEAGTVTAAAERLYMSQTSMAKVVKSVNAPPCLIKEVATG